MLSDEIAVDVIPVSLGGKNTGENGNLVNSVDGYINAIQREMYSEIGRRQSEASLCNGEFTFVL